MNVTAAGNELCSKCSIPLFQYAGSLIYLRKNPPVNFKELVQLRKQGWTIAKLASKYSRTTRQISNIINKCKEL